MKEDNTQKKDNMLIIGVGLVLAGLAALAAFGTYIVSKTKNIVVRDKK